MKERLKAIKEEFGIKESMIQRVVSTMGSLMAGVDAYAQEYSDRENRALKTENRDLLKFIKSHGLEYKPNESNESNEDDDDDEE